MNATAAWRGETSKVQVLRRQHYVSATRGRGNRMKSRLVSNRRLPAVVRPRRIAHRHKCTNGTKGILNNEYIDETTTIQQGGGVG